MHLLSFKKIIKVIQNKTKKHTYIQSDHMAEWAEWFIGDGEKY